MKIQSDTLDTAINDFKAAIASWTYTRGSSSLKAAYSADRKDLRNVLSLMRKGQFKDAWQEAQSLDNIVRDVIPDSAWNLMKSLG